MGYRVTSLRRQLAMGALLVFAVAGGVIRHYAPEGSTLRDIGTLLLVLWLPAVGNLIGFLIRKLPRSAPPPTDFAPGAAFAPQVRLRLDPVPVDRESLAALPDLEVRCALLVGRHGFTVRLRSPVKNVITSTTPQVIEAEFLRPVVALKTLRAGTTFHVLAGTTAIAKGEVLEVVSDKLPAER